MIESIKDIATISPEQDMIPIASESFDMVKLLNKVVKNAQAKITHQQIKVILKLPELEQSSKFKGSPCKIESLLRSFIQQSLCRMSNGIILIKVNEANHGLDFSIRDTGSGFSERELMHISTDKSSFSLLNEKQIINEYGGRLIVKSEVSLGTFYLFTLHLEKLDVNDSVNEIKFEHIADWFGDDTEQLKNFVLLAINCVLDELDLIKREKPSTNEDISEIYHRLKPHLTTLDLIQYYDEMPRPDQNNFEGRMSEMIEFIEDKVAKIEDYTKAL